MAHVDYSVGLCFFFNKIQVFFPDQAQNVRDLYTPTRELTCKSLIQSIHGYPQQPRVNPVHLTLRHSPEHSQMHPGTG